MKQKIQLGTLVAGVDFFIFDADVILFKVPDLEAVQKVDPEATIFYQRDFRSYLQYYAGAEKKNPDTTGSPWLFNSGQIYMRATPETLAVQQSSLNLGPGGMEQAVLKYAIILRVREHKLRSAQLPVGYGTGCNPTFKGQHDWASPSVIKHLPEFTSMHACCGFGKLGGMLTVNAVSNAWLNSRTPSCAPTRSTLGKGLAQARIRPSSSRRRGFYGRIHRRFGQAKHRKHVHGAVPVRRCNPGTTRTRREKTAGSPWTTILDNRHAKTNSVIIGSLFRHSFSCDLATAYTTHDGMW